MEETLLGVPFSAFQMCVSKDMEQLYFTYICVCRDFDFVMTISYEFYLFLQESQMKNVDFASEMGDKWVG